ncbi:hypothetical protein TRVA0_061S00496 [Trichomonascus vanleenenianus]|uniref:holo-[acyl-carrier-protein] synthase n=1 Tax=Trichomonascus vanleenenianus TaxID=2268995 RepID=UPI003ECABBDC
MTKIYWIDTRGWNEFDFEKVVDFAELDGEKLRRKRVAIDRYEEAASGLLKQFIFKEITPAWKAIKVTRNQHGKPIVEKFENVRFSASHQNGITAVGVRYDGQDLGIDLAESNNLLHGALDLVFSNSERSQIKDDQSFGWFWSAKEAILKYIGCGFLTDEYKHVFIQVNYPEISATNSKRNHSYHGQLFELQSEKLTLAVVTQSELPREAVTLTKLQLSDIIR